MRKQEAIDRATKMDESGEYDHAVASPDPNDPFNDNAWIVMARTAGVHVREVEER